MNLKTLSIKQPYAAMIISGRKTIETRTWKTFYRGELLLHACKKPASEISGCAFALVELCNCLPMREVDEKYACITYDSDLYSWILGNIRLIKPIQMKGQQGLFNADVKINLLVGGQN